MSVAPPIRYTNKYIYYILKDTHSLHISAISKIRMFSFNTVIYRLFSNTVAKTLPRNILCVHIAQCMNYSCVFSKASSGNYCNT